MFDDGADAAGDDDRPEQGPLLPPDDRLWRHPSEVGASRSVAPAANATAPDEAAAGRRFPWGVSVLSAVAGASAAIGVLLIVGGIGTRVVERDVVQQVGVQPAGTVPAGFHGGVAEIADSLTPAIVSVHGEDGQVATGVVYRDDGLVVTTAHGLGDDEEVTVTPAGGQPSAAEVLGVDPWTDLAVVRLDGEAFETAPLGSSSEVAVGDSALVMAAPLGGSSAPTVTVGVISALDQALDTAATETLHGLIRTDAGIQPEATGGALLDRSGSLIGIVTVLPDDQPIGVGFAMPVDTAMDIADDLARYGHARHVWLGIEGDDLAADEAEDLGVAGGAEVGEVAEDSPAATAGLETDDVIVAVGGEEVSSMSDLIVHLREQQPGDAVQLDYLRDGEPATCTATLGERTT